MLRLVDFALIAAALAPHEAMAAGMSRAQACTRLLEAAKDKHLAIENSVGAYRCEPYMATRRLFVFQLHYAGGEAPDWKGSTLAGYYAVRKSDRAVVRWNLGDDTPGEVVFK